MNLRIISGGQTGVDRAALDVAIARNIPHGGYCPIGRRAEDGRIDDKYQLVEFGTKYLTRTKRNVDEADATLILFPPALRDAHGDLTGGTARTADYVHGWQPLLIVSPDAAGAATARAWLDRVTLLRPPAHDDVFTLNVAGPRASRGLDIYRTAYACLALVFP